jgi:hypothetical protein
MERERERKRERGSVFGHVKDMASPALMGGSHVERKRERKRERERERERESERER